MKKLAALLMTLLVLFALTVAGAEFSTITPEPPPAEILSALSPQLAAGWMVTDCLERFGDGPYFAAVTLRNASGKNRLVLLAEDARGWNVQLTTDIALSQDAPIRLEDRTHTVCAGLYLQTALACIEKQVSAEETVWEWDARSGQWVLRAYMTHDTDFSTILDTVVVQSTGLTYTGWRTEGRTVRYRGTVQTLLRYFDESVFPKTPEAMQRKLTVAPSIPAGELTAQNIQFTGGKKYSAYSGPGEDYLRGGNGKAAVSTNDWIQVFGEEDGWMLIQYAIDRDHMRFGWIPVAALPRGAHTDPLDFIPTTAYTNRRIAITDDPLYTGAALVELPEGCWVTWLATMGDWAYIESSTGDLLRGFVPVDALRHEKVFDLSDHPADHYVALRGSVSVDPVTGHCEARVTLAPDSPLSPDQVISYGFFDDYTGQWLSFADGTDWTGYHVTSFTILDDTTAIRIVPQYADGSYADAYAVVVAW